MRAGFSLVEYLVYIMATSFVVALSLQLVAHIQGAIKHSYIQSNNARTAAVIYQTLSRDIFFTDNKNISSERNKLNLISKNTHISWYRKNDKLCRKIYDVTAQTNHTAIVAANIASFTVNYKVTDSPNPSVKTQIQFKNSKHAYKNSMQSGWIRHS